jgi:hypothetical protein
MRQWERDVSRALQGLKSPTRQEEADYWREALGSGTFAKIFARMGTVAQTGVGMLNTYRLEEEALISEFQPRLCWDRARYKGVRNSGWNIGWEYRMTRERQKKRERAFVEEAARLLGAAWKMDDREPPDFEITEGNGKFGLEVTEIFAGLNNHGGAEMKKRESKMDKRIDELRREYEAKHNIALWVRFTGNVCHGTLAIVVKLLESADFPSRPMWEAVRLDGRNGLYVRARKQPKADWQNIMDRVGWMDRWPHGKIADAIAKKANELPRYKAEVGDDVRLLIVADQFRNSGKLRLEQRDAAFDLHGFTKVYFYSYPESVVELTSH